MLEDLEYYFKWSGNNKRKKKNYTLGIVEALRENNILPIEIIDFLCKNR
jgi:hypothetical protein